MNESELRRRELLRQTRKLYDERREVPAVHPSYGRICQELYSPSGAEGEKPSGGSFVIRIVAGAI